MYKTISNKIIREFNPCYDPSKYITDENEELSVKQWIEKYKNVVPIKDIFWLLIRKEYLSYKDLRLFAVWCAREALKLIKNPDERSVEACNVAERYANKQATKKELIEAHEAIVEATKYLDNIDNVDNYKHNSIISSIIFHAVSIASFVYSDDDYNDNLNIDDDYYSSFSTFVIVNNTAVAARFDAYDAANADGKNDIDAEKISSIVKDKTHYRQLNQLLTYFE